MCTREIKFYNGERVKEGLKKYYSKELSENKNTVWSLFSATTDEKNWGLEFEKKISLSTGTIKVKSLLETNDEKSADILYDFKGKIFMKRYLENEAVKIEEDTFTRLFPLYLPCLLYDNIEFEIEGDISFKIGISTYDFRTTVARASFDSALNNQYFLRYSGGACALYKTEKNPRVLQYRNKVEFLDFVNKNN